MFQLKEKLKWPIYLYKHQHEKSLILDEVVDVTIKYKNIARWIVTAKE
jgi:hypothetical protein